MTSMTFHRRGEANRLFLRSGKARKVLFRGKIKAPLMIPPHVIAFSTWFSRSASALTSQ